MLIIREIYLYLYFFLIVSVTIFFLIETSKHDLVKPMIKISLSSPTKKWQLSMRSPAVYAPFQFFLSQQTVSYEINLWRKYLKSVQRYKHHDKKLHVISTCPKRVLERIVSIAYEFNISWNPSINPIFRMKDLTFLAHTLPASSSPSVDTLRKPVNLRYLGSK